jgi:hypothetical protein
VRGQAVVVTSVHKRGGTETAHLMLLVELQV